MWASARRSRSQTTLQHGLGQRPVVLEQRQEVAPLEDQQRAVGDGGGVRRAGAAVEQRDLAEDRAGTELGQQDRPRPSGVG